VAFIINICIVPRRAPGAGRLKAAILGWVE
jgi:hypothetical protein